MQKQYAEFYLYTAYEVGYLIKYGALHHRFVAALQRYIWVPMPNRAVGGAGKESKVERK